MLFYPNITIYLSHICTMILFDPPLTNKLYSPSTKLFCTKAGRTLLSLPNTSTKTHECGRVLRQISLGPPNPILSLVHLLTVPNADVVFMSLRLVDAMIQRSSPNNNLRTQFKEVGGVNTLESICNWASSQYYKQQQQQQQDNSP